LRKRGLLELSILELLEKFLDTDTSDRERISLKNRLVRACRDQTPPREELEGLLEKAIAEDVSILKSFDDEFREYNRSLLRNTFNKSKVLRLKFQAERARGIALDQLLGGDAAAEALSGALTAADNDGEQMYERREATGVPAPQEDRSASSLLAGLQEGELVNIAEVFKDHPTICAFDVQVPGVGSMLRSVHKWRTRYFVGESLEEVPSHLFIVDGSRRQFLLISYGLWDPVKIPFNRVKLIEWTPTEGPDADSTLRIHEVRRPQASCTSREWSSSHHTRVRVIKFQAPEQRDAFCARFFKLECTKGIPRWKAEQDDLRNVFTYDDQGRIEQLL
jgi:hypothetical protein